MGVLFSVEALSFIQSGFASQNRTIDMKLLIEKIKLALQKRTGSAQQKKNHASWVAKG